jgi:hypothetical protein
VRHLQGYIPPAWTGLELEPSPLQQAECLEGKEKMMTCSDNTGSVAYEIKVVTKVSGLTKPDIDAV